MQKFLGILFLWLFLILNVVPVSAQEAGIAEQNVVLSCLEPTNTDLVLTGGELNNYSTGLYDKSNIFKEENGPVYVLISYPVPGFKPADSKFSDTCEHRHNSNQEGQYWFCADLKGNGSQCPANMLSPNTQIMQPKNAPKEPSDPDEGPCLKTIFQIESPKFENGQFKVDWAQMYTLLHNNVTFWGLQFTSDEATMSATPTQMPVGSTALKLATFIGESSPGIPEGALANCTTISWDPYGRIIDSYTLEPIRDVLVSLKNSNANNVLELTKNPNDPTFRNPFTTNSQGGFNFAVIPGTYYLYPEHPDFIFPITDQTIHNQALANLRLFDPLGEYVTVNKANSKVYLNPQEAIIEVAGASQRRDIIMQPKNQNYQGSPIELISVSNTRQGIQQLVKGIVSHPKAMIYAMINNQVVGQTEADYEGNFTLLLNEELIPANAQKYEIIPEKVPLVKTASPTAILAQEEVEKQLFSLIPAVLSGFIFNQDYQILPNTKVESVLEGLTNLAYATVYTNNQGFIAIPYQNLPPSSFLLKVYPANQTPFLLTISQFLKLNTVYIEESGINLFNPKIATENLISPSDEIINKVKSTTATRLSGSNIFAIPTPVKPTETPNPTQNTNLILRIVLALVALILLALLFTVIVKNFKKTTPPPQEPPDTHPEIPNLT